MYLNDEVSKEKLNAGWQDNFTLNQDDSQKAQLKERLEQFKTIFITVKKGDVIYLDYLPDKGTPVTINNALKGTIPGFDFHQGLMKVWLGDEHADWCLKEALLGE